MPALKWVVAHQAGSSGSDSQVLISGDEARPYRLGLQSPDPDFDLLGDIRLQPEVSLWPGPEWPELGTEALPGIPVPPGRLRGIGLVDGGLTEGSEMEMRKFLAPERFSACLTYLNLGELQQLASDLYTQGVSAVLKGDRSELAQTLDDWGATAELAAHPEFADNLLLRLGKDNGA